MMDCVGIVLAAGSSSRMGRPKQLLCFQGEPMLARTVRLLREAGAAPVLVVLGFQSALMRASVPSMPGVIFVENSAWSDGISTSIRTGIEAALKLTDTPRNVLISVCDQPALSTQVLGQLFATHAKGFPLTASRYQGCLGVPAIFSSRYFPGLLALNGDQGARKLLEQDSATAGIVDFPGGALDLDLAQDVQRLKISPKD